MLVDVLLMLLAEQMFVGDGDGDLGFYLQKLVLHVESHLLQHFLGIFRAIDQVIEIRPYESGNAFK
jgi:hypothetical protein